MFLLLMSLGDSVSDIAITSEVEDLHQVALSCIKTNYGTIILHAVL